MESKYVVENYALVPVQASGLLAGDGFSVSV